MGSAPNGPGKKAPSWANTPCGTMSASVLGKFGPPEPSDCFTYVIQYPKPSLPSKDWVMHTNHPKILGEDFVGEVEEAGSDSGYKVGDVVCGFAYVGGKPYDGAYAEYTICHKQRTLKLPDTARDMPWEVLGAVPMSLWTAYGSIFSGGQTKPGDTVFIHGATSSVGLWAILVCKDRGCKVIASTRQKIKIQKLKD